jgi:Glycosyl hydrolases family 2, TIM barrel domain
MPLPLSNLLRILLPLFGIGAGVCQEPETVARSAAIAVEIRAEGLLRDGKPYFVKGGGGSGCPKQLAARGGNSLRTWDTNHLDQTLDRAETLGLTVSAGIWLEPECSWFSYSNSEHCAKQVARVRDVITRHRAHPALLAWGLGNEIEGDGSNAALWQQLDRLALLVRELDPAHPTFTAVAGMNAKKAAAMNAHAPHLSFVGINTYGAVFGLRRQLNEMGWKRPWMLTEWGPRGFWEVPKAGSGAPFEQTSSEKAEMVRKAYREVIHPSGGCLGSYVFIWGWKYEATATWFGIFTHVGETTAVADALQEVWGGGKIANRAPGIAKMTGVPKTALAPGARFEASVPAQDADGDPLAWEWAVLPETTKHNANVRPPMPKPVEAAILKSSADRASIRAPVKPGVYRLHAWVRDGQGHAATANQPFEVKALR